jgi:hypothetical protein
MRPVSYALTALLVTGLSWAAPADAQAQFGQRQRGGYSVQGSAYDNGYREGLAEGARDARDGRGGNARRHDVYRDGDRGYDGRYGNRGQYKQAFRDGFERGYSEGYSQYSRSGRAVPRDRGYGYPGAGRYPDQGRYPDNGRYPDSRYPNIGRYPTYPGDRGGYGGYGSYSPASDKGFSEGYEKGLDDGNDGDRFAPEQHKWYREGDRGYKGSYGSRDRYKIEYREAFRQGYDQGYRDSRGGGRTQNRRWPF